jgi:hypothetical protein
MVKRIIQYKHTYTTMRSIQTNTVELYVRLHSKQDSLQIFYSPEISLHQKCSYLP